MTGPQELQPQELHQFLADRRERIIDRTRRKVADGPAPPPRGTEAEMENGIPQFLTQLIGLLGADETCSAEIGASAAKHGNALLHVGFSVGEVVKDYGALCQAITEIAVEEKFPVRVEDFKSLNGCLDEAIAAAVSAFERQRDQAVADQGAVDLGFLVHEMRNALHAATFAFELIRKGTVGAGGTIGALLVRNLNNMREVIDRSMADVRLKSRAQKRAPVSLKALLHDLAFSAAVEAEAYGQRFTLGPVPGGVTVDADLHLLTSALTNLLQNAFKFTRLQGRVVLRVAASAERVRIEIEDECGGLPGGNVDDLFQAFEQNGTNRSGLGLGLAISRQAVEAHGGTIEVRDLPGQGCIFSVDLPRCH